jgi:hypothetical protein
MRTALSKKRPRRSRIYAHTHFIALLKPMNIKRVVDLIKVGKGFNSRRHQISVLKTKGCNLQPFFCLPSAHANFAITRSPFFLLHQGKHQQVLCATT